MKTCLDCMTTTTNDDLKRCNVCGGQNFKSGRPKTGYKMDPTEQKNGTMQMEKTPVKKDDTSRSTAQSNVNMQQGMTHDMGQIDYGDYTDDITVGKWIITFILMAIPIVGIIYAIITIATKKQSKSYTNYMIAALIMTAIAVVLSLVLGSVLTSLIVNMMYGMY